MNIIEKNSMQEEIDPLFADVVLSPLQTGTYYPIKKKCNVCWQWFETKDKYANQCSKHLGHKPTKLIQRVYGPNDLPFRNYSRQKKQYE